MPTHTFAVDYEQPVFAAPAVTQRAWARTPVEPGPAERRALKDNIRRLLTARNAVMVSHYYVHPDCKTWRRKLADWSVIRWKWPGLAETTPPKRWWLPACASWARQPRYCRRKSRC